MVRHDFHVHHLLKAFAIFTKEAWKFTDEDMLEMIVNELCIVFNLKILKEIGNVILECFYCICSLPWLSGNS